MMQARSLGRPSEEPIISVIGIGLADQFEIARQACTGGLEWRGAYSSIAALVDVQVDDNCILLLDGDTASPDTIDVLERDEALRRGALLILQTSRPDVRLVVSVMKRGVADVLTKPYAPARLKGAVREARTRLDRPASMNGGHAFSKALRP